MNSENNDAGLPLMKANRLSLAMPGNQRAAAGLFDKPHT
jgi:hypothetical protein